MTTRLIITCDAAWDGGRMPCRGAFPARSTIETVATAEATAAGWSMTVDGDLCPAHARREGAQQAATDREAL